MEEFDLSAHMSEMRRVAFERGRLEGRKEVVKWIKEHPLIAPDENSLTKFEPFYQIEHAELKKWGIDEKVTTEEA